MDVGFVRYEKFSQQSIVTRTLFSVASHYGVDFFYANAKEIDISRKVINATVWDKESKTYVQKEIGYPKVLDVSSALSYTDPAIHDELFKTVVFSNGPRFGGKSKIYDVIKDCGYEKYLIETCNYSEANIEELLGKYKTLIIKPNHGALAKNIYKLTTAGDMYELRIDNEVMKLTKDEFQNDYDAKFRRGYIVQRYVDSVTNSGNPFTIRALILRGKDGEFTTRKVSARIGSIGYVAANFSVGSVAYYNVILPMEFGDGWRSIYYEILNMSLRLSEGIQKSYPRLIDGFGFDIGIDRSNNNELKIFEVNPYPGVIPFGFECADAKINYYMYLMDNHEEILKNQLLNP